MRKRKIVPEKFTITFDETDRTTAGPFPYPRECIIATAIRRRFAITQVLEGVKDTTIDGREYDHRAISGKNVCQDKHAKTRPFYGKAVVGRRVTFRRRKD